MRHKLRLFNLILIVVFIFSFTACTIPKTATETTAAETTTVETTIAQTAVTEQPSEETSDALLKTIEAKANELKAKDQENVVIEDIKDAIELASEAQEAGLDEIAEDLMNWAKDALSAIAQQALSKSPCDAEMEDIKNAVEISSEAQKLGLDELANSLLSWAKNSLRSIASRSINSGAGEKERIDLAQTAQELGLDDLADDILEGREITPVYTYSVHAELKGIHPETEITYHFIVDAYTCNEDVHIGWKGKLWFEATGYGQTESVEEALSFDLPRDGSYVVILPEYELGASIVGENVIIFTAVFYADEYYEPVDFPPANIKQGALANIDSNLK